MCTQRKCTWYEKDSMDAFIVNNTEDKIAAASVYIQKRIDYTCV